MADQLWLMTRIREEEVNSPVSYKGRRDSSTPTQRMDVQLDNAATKAITQHETAVPLICLRHMMLYKFVLIYSLIDGKSLLQNE